MAPSLFSKAFIIVKLDENGEPVEIMPYDKNEATYVAVSISICRGMLKKQIVKNCFKSLAKDLDPTSFLTRADATLSAEVFIEKILEEFPLVFVDYSRKNPNEAGYHLRRPWGDTESAWFESHDHAIGINGPVSRKKFDLTISMIESADHTIEGRRYVLRWVARGRSSLAGFRHQQAVPNLFV